VISKERSADVSIKPRYCRIESSSKVTASTRTRTFYNWLQHFAPEDLEQEFLEVCFTINELYSDVAGSPFDKESSEFGVVAERG